MFCLPVRSGAAVAVLVSSTVVGLAAQPQPGAGAAAQAVRISDTGRISITADAVPVQLLLDAIQPACAMTVRVDAATAARPVSVEVADLPPMSAVVAVLRASGLDFAMEARCGTVRRPALVVLRAEGNGPPELPAAPIAASTRAATEVAAAVPDAPAVEPETPKEPEPRSSIGVIAGDAGGALSPSERAPGQLTGAQMVERLSSPAPARASSIIELPFTDQNGQPYRQVRPAGAAAQMMRPFPDAAGRPVFVPVPGAAKAKARTAGFPVVTLNGQAPATGKAGASAANPATPAGARRPGGGVQP